MALRMVINKTTGFVAKFYQGAVASQLTQTGEYVLFIEHLVRLMQAGRQAGMQAVCAISIMVGPMYCG